MTDEEYEDEILSRALEPGAQADPESSPQARWLKEPCGHCGVPQYLRIERGFCCPEDFRERQDAAVRHAVAVLEDKGFRIEPPIGGPWAKKEPSS